jgi:hypothetical protein
MQRYCVHLYEGRWVRDLGLYDGSGVGDRPASGCEAVLSIVRCFLYADVTQMAQFNVKFMTQTKGAKIQSIVGKKIVPKILGISRLVVIRGTVSSIWSLEIANKNNEQKSVTILAKDTEEP